MRCIRFAVIFLAALLCWTECVLSRPIQKRQTLQQVQEAQEDETTNFKFVLHSRSSRRYVKMLENGSVVASGLKRRGRYELSSMWCLHKSEDGYFRLENAQYPDHYLALAHNLIDNTTALVAHNVSEPFTPEMMVERERELSGDGEMQNNTQQNQTESSETSEETFSFLFEWDIQPVGKVETNIKLVRNDADCYLSFDHEGYPHKNLCSMPSMGNQRDIVIVPVV